MRLDGNSFPYKRTVATKWKLHLVATFNLWEYKMPNFKERSLAFSTVDAVGSIPDDCKDGTGSIETLVS